MDQENYENYLVQKDLQQHQSDNQAMLYAPQMQEQIQQNQAVVIQATDPRSDVKDFLLELRGQAEIHGEIVQVDDPLVNELGVQKIKSVLRPLMVNTTRFTRLKDSMIKYQTMDFIDNLIFDLGIKWREYGIKDRSTCDHIISVTRSLIFSILSRSEDQNEKNWIGRIAFENVSGGNANIKPKKESWYDKIKL